DVYCQVWDSDSDYRIF
nr:immunoglobulin light chain junction region [Macaca mulatta]